MEKIEGIKPLSSIIDLKLRGGTIKDFESFLKDCQKKIEAEDVLIRLKKSYNQLVFKTGITPNAVVISDDYLNVLKREHFDGWDVQTSTDVVELMGMELIHAAGKEVIEAAIVYKEE